MNKFVIIDGNAMLHRAYHAYPALTNNKGEVINAVYGFFSMLFTLILDQKPDYLAVCFDRAAPTFRQSLFAGYQQGRPSLPDDFVPQIALVHEFLDKLGVAVFELDGYEADDLIGTLALRAVSRKGEKDKRIKGAPSISVSSAPDIEVVIVTGDRDLLQLVNSHVKILMPLMGLTKTALFGEREVEEKYGVTPSQFIDYKALIGDASDGYPGVAGIGPKGAAKLIQEYSTFENLYQNIDKLPEKIGLKLATDAEQAALAKKLATIETDVPVQFDIKKCKCLDFNPEELHAEFVDQGFKTLTKRLDDLFKLNIEVNENGEDTKTATSKEEKVENDQLELL